MAAATLTSKGQLTLPRKIRDHLEVAAGDAINFVIGSDGEVCVRAGNVDVRNLRGLLHKPGRRPVTLEQMDEAIASARGRRP